MTRVALVAFLAFVAVLAAFSSPALAGELETSIRLTPERIGLAETATLEIEARRSGFGRLRFQPEFELDNLELVSGPYEMSETSSINGAFARSLRLAWQLRPLGTGRAAVHAVRLRVGGGVVDLPAQFIEVQEEPAGLAAPRRVQPRPRDAWERFFGGNPFEGLGRPDRPRVFLDAEVAPERPYAGQQAVYTLYLYTRDDVDAIQPKSLPEFRGFWVRELPLAQRLPTEMVEVDGVRYGRVVLFKKAIFALRPGRHELAPSVMELIVRVGERRFFGPPMTRPEQLTASSPPVAVEVRALPPAPVGFSGAVGRLELAARLEPQELAVGEAATLTLTLAGDGNLQGVRAPELPERRYLEVFPPQQQAEEEIREETVRGRRSWSWVVVPERAGRYALNLPEVPFFDPQTASYRLASAPVVELAVRPAEPGSAAAAARLHSIRSAALPPEPARRFDERLLPWLFALPWVGVVAGIVWRRNGGRAGHGRVRGGAPAKVLAGRLREAEGEERPRQAAARIEEAWRDYLAARWNLPPGTASTVWAEKLAAQGAEREAARELVQLADDLHYLRYAPQLSATETLRREAVERSRRLLRRLR
ncbi:MAG TPA: BatD family protein [Thermoanaerobaculia bacterium]|nr:BatD family protein [Thermoanaerobaculia bacterium]